MANVALQEIALLVLALAVMGLLAHRLKIPPSVGYLLVGIGVAWQRPEWGHTAIVELGHELGVLVLLFFIGLELDLQRLRRALKSTALVLPFDLLLPGLAAAGVARLLGWDFAQAAALGICVGLSSTLFGERLTQRAGRPVRDRVIGVLVAEDVAAAGLLAILVLLGGEGAGWAAPILSMAWLMFLMLMMTAIAILVVPRILDWISREHQNELVVLASLATLCGFGAIGGWAGSAELGALVAGIAAAEAGSRFVVRNSLAGVRILSLAVFFFASGAAVAPGDLMAAPLMVLLIATVVFVGKFLVHVPASAMSGLPLKQSLESAFALGTLGEFSLILVAAAQSAGVAHPLLAGTVVGAMVLLLFIAPVMMRLAGPIAQGFYNWPDRVKDPFEWLIQGARRSRRLPASTRGGRQDSWRRLGANVLFLVAWGIFAAWAAAATSARFTLLNSIGTPILVFGIAAAVAFPIIRSGYRSYRDLVWSMIGLRPGEKTGAGRVRARFVDAGVLLSGSLLLLGPLSLWVPRAWPVLLGALLLAIIVALVAWRSLGHFHKAVEASIGRVLGHDPKAGALLDKVLQEYPWGVRFAAVHVPGDSPIAGMSLKESRLSELTGSMVAVLQRGQREFVNPGPGLVVRPKDTLVLMGDLHQLERAEAFIVAHGEALRLTVQSRFADIEEILITAASPGYGKSLHEVGIKEQSGAMIAGVWSVQASRPKPYDPSLILGDGDRIILMGTPLQLDRAKELLATDE